MAAIGRYIYCDGGTFCVCPKCGTRNKPDAEQCGSCGVDLAREIKKSMLEQVQVRAWRADRRKRLVPGILIFTAVFGLVLGMALDLLIRGSSEDPSRYREAAEAAVEYGVKVSPYKWVSADGNLALLTIPEFTNVGVAMSFKTLIYNRTDQYCLYLNRNVYAIDNLGVTHTTNQPSLIQEDLIRLPADKTYLVETQLYPALSPNATRLTIYYPEYCGITTDPVVVDLTGQAVSVK